MQANIFKYLLDFSRINSGLIFSISIGLAYVYRCDTGSLCTQNRNYLAEYRCSFVNEEEPV